MDLLDELKNKLRSATQLTREGRLQDATAAIQSALGAPARPVAAAGASDAAIDVEFRVVEEAAPPPQARPASGGGEFLSGRYTAAAGSRAYRLYVPGAHHVRPLPLVVMLHGCTQQPDDFAAGTRMNRLAEEQGWFVLYPAQAQEANASRCWNWFQPQDQRRGEGEPAIIAGATRAIAAAYEVAPERIYIAGLSAGAAMALNLAIAYPDIYAAVGVHSGLPYGVARDVPSAMNAMKQGASVAAPAAGGTAVPAIVFHGDADRTVHPRNADAIVEQWILQATGPSDAAPSVRLAQAQERGSVPAGRGYTRTVYRDSGGNVMLEQWRVEGGGHAWSGGSPQGSHTDPQGPDASSEMLRFFREHPHK